MFLGTEFEKTRIIDSRIKTLEEKKLEKIEDEEVCNIDEDLLSTGFTENSHTAEGYKMNFMTGIYDLFRSEDKDNFGHISYESMVKVRVNSPKINF